MLAKFWDGFISTFLLFAVLGGIAGGAIWAILALGAVIGLGVVALVTCVLVGLGHALFD